MLVCHQLQLHAYVRESWHPTVLQLALVLELFPWVPKKMLFEAEWGERFPLERALFLGVLSKPAAQARPTRRLGNEARRVWCKIFLFLALVTTHRSPTAQANLKLFVVQGSLRLIIVLLWVFCLHRCLCNTCMSDACRGQKRSSDPPWTGVTDS